LFKGNFELRGTTNRWPKDKKGY